MGDGTRVRQPSELILGIATKDWEMFVIKKGHRESSLQVNCEWVYSRRESLRHRASTKTIVALQKERIDKWTKTRICWTAEREDRQMTAESI